MSVGQISNKSLFAKSVLAKSLLGKCLFAKCLFAKCLSGNSMFAKYIVQISVGQMSVKCVFAKSLSSIQHFTECQRNICYPNVCWPNAFRPRVREPNFSLFLFSNKFWNKKKIVQCFCCRDIQHFFIFGTEIYILLNHQRQYEPNWQPTLRLISFICVGCSSWRNEQQQKILSFIYT